MIRDTTEESHGHVVHHNTKVIWTEEEIDDELVASWCAQSPIYTVHVHDIHYLSLPADYK